MSDERQKNQLKLAFTRQDGGEAIIRQCGRTESNRAMRGTEIPVMNLMEEIADIDNLKRAYFKVKGNAGAAGIDGMTVDELGYHFAAHHREIRQSLLQGEYKPQAVRPVDIPKQNGGTRRLGIPCAIDRLIQQAMLNVLQQYWEPAFSEHSYGFRPGRSQQQAVLQAQKYVCSGLRFVVDIDLEKFFDRVNHDILMGLIAKRVKDKRVLKLIRAFLNAGVMVDGVVQPLEEGTPQGGPLSPWLSNVMLDELDWELEKRKLKFVRYADDSNIYVGSERAGQRVMESITRFLNTRLKLKVNTSKSAVARPWDRKFLGFSFTDEQHPRCRIAPQALKRAKQKLKELTRRKRGNTLEQIVEELAKYLNGWREYYHICEANKEFSDLEGWIRRRLRCLIWARWKNSKRRYRGLVDRNVPDQLARQHAASSKGAWRLSLTPALSIAFPNDYFRRLGLPDLVKGAT